MSHKALGVSFEDDNSIGSQKLLADGNTGVVGYTFGKNGTLPSVTQATSKSTGVTLNAATGQVTMNNAALAAGSAVYYFIRDVKKDEEILGNYGQQFQLKMDENKYWQMFLDLELYNLKEIKYFNTISKFGRGVGGVGATAAAGATAAGMNPDRPPGGFHPLGGVPFNETSMAQGDTSEIKTSETRGPIIPSGAGGMKSS